MELAFAERTLRTRCETYRVPLDAEAAKELVDLFAEEIYSAAFFWLLGAINEATCAKKKSAAVDSNLAYGLIGVLHVLGFEVSSQDDFEQICMNYCNEKLWQKFLKDTFHSLQEDYAFERFEDTGMDDTYRSDVLELYEGRCGFFDMLNEECIRPDGTAFAFLAMFLAASKQNPSIFCNSRASFGVHHYGAAVVYSVEDFLVKNKSKLTFDIIQAAKTCKNEIFSKHFGNNNSTNQDEVTQP